MDNNGDMLVLINGDMLNIIFWIFLSFYMIFLGKKDLKNLNIFLPSCIFLKMKHF